MMTMTSHISSLVTPSSDHGGILWLAKWCINGFILVHEYIHSHSTATLSFNMYTNSRSTTYFSVTNIFIYSCNISSDHSHSRSKFLFNTVAIFIQQFVNVLKFTNSMFLHIERFNSFSRIHSFTFKVKNFIQHCCYIYSTFYAHPSLHIPRFQPALSFGNRRPTMVIWSAPVRRCLREEI